MKFNNRQNKMIHGESGKVHWISRSLAVVVVVVLNKKKVLLVKRGKKVKASGKWCVPCGYLDWNENAKECAIREIWEETGLDVTKCKISVNHLDKPYDIVTEPSLNYSQDIAIHFGINVESYVEPFVTTKNSEPGESDDVKWVHIEDINQYQMAFRHDERIKTFLKLID